MITPEERERSMSDTNYTERVEHDTKLWHKQQFLLPYL